MTRAFYWDPATDSEVEFAAPIAEVSALVEVVLALQSRRGHPALEFRRGDGARATLGTDGVRAMVTWTNALGESFASVGTAEGDGLVYDYFGSWSEAPGTSLVPLNQAVLCMDRFLSGGPPDTEGVLFSPS